MRYTNISDLDNIYNLQINCFNVSDQWYKYIISQYLNDGIIIELCENKKIIGVLLQGDINIFENENFNNNFIPITDKGHKFIKNMDHIKTNYGIVMICIDPLYRRKGLASKLIIKHQQNNSKKILCLNTRKSNIQAIELYKKLRYEHIGDIKNKYFFPIEDSNFMIFNYNH